MAIDIHCFNEPPYLFIDIWVRIIQIQYVQPALCNADPAHAAALEASLHQHCLHYSRGRLSVTAVQNVIEPFNHFDPLICTDERQMVLFDDCYVVEVDESHGFNMLRSLRQFTDSALLAMSDHLPSGIS